MELSEYSVDMRTSLCSTLIELSKNNGNIVWLDADLLASSGMMKFKEAFPERVIDCGIQEANMMGVACGLSAEGMVPFVHSFAPFSSRRIADQIFVSGIYAGQSVRIVGSDPGILAGPNGGTHISLEDMAILRSMPGTVVLDPCDAAQLTGVIKNTVSEKGIYYIRLARKSKVKFYSSGQNFTVGKAVVYREGSDVTIIAAGAVCMAEAVKAAGILHEDGIEARILDMFTVKPLDSEAVLRAAAETRAVITLENHNILNGLGSAVAEVIAENSCGALFKRMGVPDCKGEVGTLEYLLEKFHMSASYVADTAKKMLKGG